MANTPIYGYPYGALSDSPDGATQTQALALALEARQVTTDAAIAASKLLSDTPVTANSSNTSGTGKVIWVNRQVSLVVGKQYKVTFDTGFDAAAISTVIFEMHYIAGGTSTLTGATKFYGRYGRCLQGGAFLSTSGAGTFTAPGTGTYTIMGAVWNSDSSVTKTNGGTPNSTDNQGRFIIELV